VCARLPAHEDASTVLETMLSGALAKFTCRGINCGDRKVYAYLALTFGIAPVVTYARTARRRAKLKVKMLTVILYDARE